MVDRAMAAKCIDRMGAPKPAMPPIADIERALWITRQGDHVRLQFGDGGYRLVYAPIDGGAAPETRVEDLLRAF